MNSFTGADLEPLANGMQPNRKARPSTSRFRNGNKVSLEAFAIDVPKLRGDVKAYLTNRQGIIDWNQVQVQNIGHRLVELNQQQYITGKVANWDLGDLTPRPDHVDDPRATASPSTRRYGQENAGPGLPRHCADGRRQLEPRSSSG